MKLYQFLCIFLLGFVLIQGCNNTDECESEIYGQLLIENSTTMDISPLADKSCILYKVDSYPPTQEIFYDSTFTDSLGIFHFYDVDRDKYIIAIPYILSLNLYEAGLQIGTYWTDYSEGCIKDIGIKTYEITP